MLDRRTILPTSGEGAGARMDAHEGWSHRDTHMGQVARQCESSFLSAQWRRCMDLIKRNRKCHHAPESVSTQTYCRFKKPRIWRGHSPKPSEAWCSRPSARTWWTKSGPTSLPDRTMRFSGWTKSIPVQVSPRNCIVCGNSWSRLVRLALWSASLMRSPGCSTYEGVISHITRYATVVALHW